jgi:hypothetical protein
MALLRKIFWLALFAASTFGFLVLFDHGTVNYVENAKADFQKFRKMVSSQIVRKKDESDKTGTAN